MVLRSKAKPEATRLIVTAVCVVLGLGVVGVLVGDGGGVVGATVVVVTGAVVVVVAGAVVVVEDVVVVVCVTAGVVVVTGGNVFMGVVVDDEEQAPRTSSAAATVTRTINCILKRIFFILNLLKAGWMGKAFQPYPSAPQNSKLTGCQNHRCNRSHIFESMQ
jgi:hypothetical protein